MIFDSDDLEYTSQTKSSIYGEKELKYFFRELNTKVLLDEYSFKPNYKNLSWWTRFKCKKMCKKGMVITGSTILKLYGLLDRKSNDIDVYWDIKKAKSENIITEEKIINCFDYKKEKNGEKTEKEEISRYKVRNKQFGVIDIFDTDSDEEVLEYRGIKHQHPLNILVVKLNYFRDKDHGDFEKLCEKLDIDVNHLD